MFTLLIPGDVLESSAEWSGTVRLLHISRYTDEIVVFLEEIVLVMLFLVDEIVLETSASLCWTLEKAV